MGLGWDEGGAAHSSFAEGDTGMLLHQTRLMKFSTYYTPEHQKKTKQPEK
jgi:hypothetical protein